MLLSRCFYAGSAATVLAMVLCIMAAPASADIIYDANGFEPFTVGALNGQDTWVGIGVPSEFEPVVIEVAPGDQAVALSGSDVSGATSAMLIGSPTNLVSYYDTVKISFDVMRSTQSTVDWQPLIWAVLDDAAPLGGQIGEPGNNVTIPLYGGDDTPTVFDRFARVELEWDLVNNTVSGWYDGNLISQLITGDIDFISGFGIGLLSFSQNSEPTGYDVAFIDNFVVTGSLIQPVPEPISLVLFVTTGVAGAFARRRLRRKSA
jgi:hypothetical protein